MMIKNTPHDCMGAQPIWRKFFIALTLLANPWVLLMDKIGLIKSPLYKTFSGIKFWTRGKTTDINDAVVVLSGNEYPDELLGLSQDLQSSPVVLDLGGHIGTFAMLIKSRWKNAKIFSMEPVKSNQDLFAKNIQANNYQDVVLIPKALFDQAGQYYIDFSGKQFDALTVSRVKPHHGDYIVIDAISLDQLLGQYQIELIDLVKMDIEGSEYIVLPKCLDQLSKVAKRLIMEYHPAGDQAKRNQLVQLFDEAGWELFYETKNILGFDNNTLKHEKQ
ncbi:MAG: FkbM family methyltransferase [Candidatus Doudnabacteria bacterium]